VQKIPGDAAVALRPADHRARTPEPLNGKTRRPIHFTFAKQGNQGSRKRYREDHYTPENFRMKCVWKNLLRRYRVRRTAGTFVCLLSFSGAGEGI
jgi:hypothetical protein